MVMFVFWTANFQKPGWWWGKCACSHNLYWMARLE
jgi:hypothetical protein